MLDVYRFCICVRTYVRPSVRPSVRPYVRPSVRPCVRRRTMVMVPPELTRLELKMQDIIGKEHKRNALNEAHVRFKIADFNNLHS